MYSCITNSINEEIRFHLAREMGINQFCFRNRLLNNHSTPTLKKTHTSAVGLFSFVPVCIHAPFTRSTRYLYIDGKTFAGVLMCANT